MRSHQFALALLVSCGFSVTASAEPTVFATVIAEPDTPTRVVSYRDLNLQRDDGVAVLYRRIQHAASIVCTQVNGRLPQVVQRARDCAADATSRAVAKVGVPALSQLHVARTQKMQTPPNMLAKRTQ